MTAANSPDAQADDGRTVDTAGRLRAALALFAKELIGADDKTFGRANCRVVLDEAGIETTDAEFDRVAVAFGQMPFYGGNYTLDARRLLKAMKS